MNESENTTYPNTWNATKAAIQGKRPVLHAYIRKRKNDLNYHCVVLL